MALFLPFQRATIAAAAASAILAHHDVSQADRASRDLSTLLVIDGDSLAHRAYHALPKSIRGAGGRPANALVGFAELPAAAVGGRAAGRRFRRLGHARRADLPARGAARATRPDASSTRRCSSSSTRCRRSSSRSASPTARRAGYEADDFLAAAAARWKGPVVIATSDRDAFQLVSDRVSILQPVKGVSELARDRAGRGARALRRRPGAGRRLHRAARRRLRPHPRRAGRRPEDGGRRCSRSTAASRRRSTAGRFSAVADNLRLYRRIAQMDAGRAAAEARRDASRTGPRAAAHATELGLNALAKRLAERA